MPGRARGSGRHERPRPRSAPRRVDGPRSDDAPDRVADAARLEARTTRQTRHPRPVGSAEVPRHEHHCSKIGAGGRRRGRRRASSATTTSSPRTSAARAPTEPTPTPIPSATRGAATRRRSRWVRSPPASTSSTTSSRSRSPSPCRPVGKNVSIPAMVLDADREGHVGFFTVDERLQLIRATAGARARSGRRADGRRSRRGSPATLRASRSRARRRRLSTATPGRSSMSRPRCSEAWRGMIQPVSGTRPRWKITTSVWILDVDGERLVIAAQDRPAPRTTVARRHAGDRRHRSTIEP